MSLKTFNTLFSKKKETFRENVDISYLKGSYSDFEEHSIFHKQLHSLIDDFWIYLSSKNDLKDFLEKETKRKLKDLLYLEMLFYFYSESTGLTKFDSNDVSVIFQKHLDILSHIKSELFLKRTIRLFKNNFSKGFLERELEWYLYDIPDSLKCFDVKEVKENVYEIQKKSSYFKIKHRLNLYHDILVSEHPYRHLPKSYNFPMPGDGINIYYQFNNEKVDIPFHFRKSLIESTHSFPMTKHIEDVKKSKKDWFDLNNYLPNHNTITNLHSLNPKGNWSNRFSSTELQSISIHNQTISLSKPFQLNNPLFELKEITNILGPVGSGKSTLIKLLLESFVKNGKKIVILESDVQKSVLLSQDLKKIGIDSAVFLGTSNISSHEESFFEINLPKYHNDGKEIKDFILENKKELELLDDTIQLKLRIEQELKNIGLKKFSVKDPHLFTSYYNGLMANPEYLNAGFYKKYHQLIESPVWIGNYHSFVSSKCPYPFDIHERNFFELSLLRSDLIIIDESDNAQLSFDDLFVEKLDLVADDGKRAANRNFADYLFKIKPEVQKSKNIDGKIRQYISNIDKLETVSRHLYTNYFTNQIIEKEIVNKNFTIFQLLTKFYEQFFNSTKPLKDDDAFLYLKNSFSTNNSSIEEIRNKIGLLKENTSSSKKIETEVNKTIKMFLDLFVSKFPHTSYSLRTQQNFSSQSNEIFTRFGFILWFSKFDLLIRGLYYNYSSFIDSIELQDQSGFNKNFIKQSLSSLDTVLPNTLINKTFSYRYNSDKESSPRSLEMFYYNAIGRKIMNELNTFYRSIEKVPNPAMLLLSGTSYTPESINFHIHRTPDYLLLNKNQEKMKIEVEYLPSFYSKNVPNLGKESELIYLSGIKEFALKKQAIQQMIAYLDKNNEFKNALNELESEFKHLNEDEKKHSRRRILSIATTSFENAQIVSEYLKENTSHKIKTLWSPKAKCNNHLIIRNDEIHISKNHVENLYDEEVDIFIFVINSIGRGYNILQSSSSSKSLIGKLYFLNRPYPVPDQFEDIIHYIHSRYYYAKEKAMKHIKDYDRWNAIVGSSYASFEDFASKEMKWSDLEEDDKKIIASNMFVQVYQTIGRGLRGGTDLKVAFLDGAFSPKTGESYIPGIGIIPSDNTYDSILSTWETMFCTNGDLLLQAMYGPFIDAIDGLVLKK